MRATGDFLSDIILEKRYFTSVELQVWADSGKDIGLRSRGHIDLLHFGNLL